MSDITKKIFSIEPEPAPKSKLPVSEVIKPVLIDDPAPIEKTPQTEVPDFVTRERVSPLSAPPQSKYDDQTNNSSAGGWIIIGLAIMYLIGAGLYFGTPLLSQTPALIPIAGMAVLLVLPLVLLFLLWRTLRHLTRLGHQNARHAKAAEILVSPDREALHRTETLAAGIQNEISNVNNSLTQTIEALSEIRNSVSKETEALDNAGLKLSGRSDDIGRNLTLQRQALESMSGTFDTRMGSLSTKISDSSDTLQAICSDAETKLVKASEAMQIASGMIDKTASDSSAQITTKVDEMEAAHQKLDDTANMIKSDFTTSLDKITQANNGLKDEATALQEMNSRAQAQISDFRALVEEGNQLLIDLRNAGDLRATSISTYYRDLSTQLKQSENETLALQGKTTRMVESNLSEMRQEFETMETELKALQTQLDDLKTTVPSVSNIQEIQPRLNLTPLDTDFLPVEVPRNSSEPTATPGLRRPLSLGLDMELDAGASLDILKSDQIQSDVIRRPGETETSGKRKGFGRRSSKEQKSGWRWRDMLGTLDRPDDQPNSGNIPAMAPPFDETLPPIDSPIPDGVEILTSIQLSPSAIVDEGTVIDATQAQINVGQTGLASSVSQKLPEAVQHLREQLRRDPELSSDLRRFSDNFSVMIENTPSKNAPALRAALGSPDGRAYLLAIAAFKG